MITLLSRRRADSTRHARPPASGQGSDLDVARLNCWYGRQQIVRDVSIRVDAGSGCALVGRNGVGKTTTMRGIAKAFGVRAEGTVMLGSTDLSRAKPEQVVQSGMALVPDDRRVLPLSVEENLKLGARGHPAWKSRMEYLLGYFPLLAPRLRQRADTMSGGEQQALAIARALMGDPQFLLLDEPAEGLAPRVVDSLIQALSATRRDRGLGLIVVDRNVEVIAALTETVGMMSKGQITRWASSRDFAASEDLRAQFLAPAEEQPADRTGP